MNRVTSLAPPVAHLVGPGMLRLNNGRLLFSRPRQTPVRIDAAKLNVLYCYGGVSVSDEALAALFRKHVEVAFLNASGRRCRGRLVGQRDSAVALRGLQHELRLKPPLKVEFARRHVLGKIRSQHEAARHYQRHGTHTAGNERKKFERLLDEAANAGSLAALRGCEGQASKRWFKVFAAVLIPPWDFPGRQRRPPRDPVNALLSLGYTWLCQRFVALAQSRGLEVTLGTLHDDRPGRPSLACDLMDPFRVPAVDRFVLGLLNQGQLRREDFLSSAETGVRLTRATFPRMLAAWESHWNEPDCEARAGKYLDDYCHQLRQLNRQTKSA